jgi:hypothetical protein
MNHPAKPAHGIRARSYWLARHYPGWVARVNAADADPLVIAREIAETASEFIRWLDLPSEQRWDAFPLQMLSAALFNRYQLKIKVYDGSPVEVSLFELRWPAGSEGIQWHVRRMQTALVPHFAVMHAAQQALLPDECPTPQELAFADAALQTASWELKAMVAALQAALAEALVADIRHTVSA